MVEEVRAWRDQKGNMHASMSDALLSDARIELESLLRNNGLVNDILNNRARVYAALDPLVMHEKLNTIRCKEEEEI